MAKSLLNCNTLLYTLVVIFLLLVIYNYFNKSLQEGIVFTPYDNSKLFTKPWNNFCINPPPSCKKDFEFGPATAGSPPIGCWCDGAGSAPELENKCTDIDYSHFY